MDLFTYLMAKKGHNTHRDLFSYLLGKNAGGSGTYTTFSGTSLNISNTLQAKIKNIALEGNASQDGDPTPEAPQDIHVVSGNNTIEVCGKNLFDKNSGIDHGKFYTKTGDIGTDAELFIQTLYIPVKSNTPYTISGYYTDYFRICEYDDEKNFIQRSLGDDSTTSFSIITTAQTKYVRISCFNRNLSSLQLEVGSTTSDYIEHQSQTYPISLGNIELARINNYKDYIFKNEVGSPYYNANLDLNEWYLHKVIGKATLTENSWGGVRNVTIGGTSRPIFYSRNDIFKSYDSMASMMCNYFQVKKTYGTSPTANNQFYCNYERTNNLEFAKFDLTTAAEWKEWLSTHNIVLIGKMVNPTNTKITDTTLIQQLENINNNARSYSDTTIIICSSESEDNETIGFSGEIKVTSVGLGNSLNTSLLSSNIQEGTNIDDIQEEPKLDEIEEQNDEPIENEEIEEPIEEYQEL